MKNLLLWTTDNPSLARLRPIVAAALGGTYTIAVVGDDAGGDYELAWEQTE